MFEFGRDANLAQESVIGRRSEDFSAQQLDRYSAAILGSTCQIDNGRGSATELAIECIATSKITRECTRRAVHGDSPETLRREGRKFGKHDVNSRKAPGPSFCNTLVSVN